MRALDVEKTIPKDWGFDELVLYSFMNRVDGYVWRKRGGSQGGW